MEDSQKFILLASKIKSLESKLSEATTKVSTVEKQIGPQGPRGDKGEPGKDGRDGRDGRDGSDGQDGRDGSDGVGIESVEVTFDNSLVVRLTDGSEIDAGEINVQGLGGSPSTAVIQQYAGPRIFVQATEPSGASVGDIWFDIS
jgi:hypothetical protein